MRADLRSVATMREVAERAGVALSSVSRVLNDHPDVSTEMRAKVLSAVNSLGYQPDLLAQSLRRGSTHTVGFVIRDISNPLFADIVKGAEAALRESGYSTLLTNSEGSPDLDGAYVKLLLRRRVDGLILSVGSETHPMTREVLSGISTPVVLLDREAPYVRAGAVLCDHYAGVRSAVAHMIELGHRRVGFIAGPRDVRASRERLRGYVDAFQSAGLVVDEDLVRLGSYEESFGYREAGELMSGPMRPTAILAGGIQLAFGSLSCLHERGIRVGHEITFVACDEVDLLRLLDPPISVVARDTVRMGQLAAELLIEMMVQGLSPRTVVLPTTYIARGSVVPPP